MKFVYQRVKDRRGELELSQSDLAAKSGLPLHEIQNIENDRVKKPSHQTILGLCQGLNVEASFFYDNYVVEMQHSTTPKAG